MGWVKIEAPRGAGCGERVSPSPLEKGLGRGLCPLSKFFFAFFASKSHVCDAL